MYGVVQRGNSHYLCDFDRVIGSESEFLVQIYRVYVYVYLVSCHDVNSVFP
jgi:hypothetical protein